MLVPNNRIYRRGAGLMDTAASLVTSALTSDAMKEAGKAAATAAGRKLGEVAVSKLTPPKVHKPTDRVQKARTILKKHLEPANMLDVRSHDINALIDGSGHGPDHITDPNKAIAIQDLVRRLNGAGLKTT